MKQYFEKKNVARQQRWAGEYVVPNHILFWEISVNETSITERWGAPGTRGDSQTTLWESSKEALQKAKGLVMEKERLGYTEKPVPEEIEEQSGKFAVKRYFERFDEFWELRIIGRSVCERSGVVGTWGDSKVSVLASLEEALKRGQDLKEEKLADRWPNGYLELPIPKPTPVEDEHGNPAPPHLRFFSRVDAGIEARFLQCLDQARKRGPADGYYFNPPASMETIAALESSHGIVLPKSMRTFLSYFDGGFIWRRKGSDIDLDHANFPDKTEIELKRDVSFPIHSASEIVKGHIQPGTLSFCDTVNGEALTVWSMHQRHQESPVFDAFHETKVNKWNILYPSFAHLFIDYVENQGLIETGWDMEADEEEEEEEEEVT